METNRNNAEQSDNNNNGTYLKIPPLLPPNPRDAASTPRDFVCAVCFELPLSAADALVTPCCQHVFCEKCLAAAIRTSHACPLDRKPIANREEAKPLDGLSKRVFESIPVVCARDGCGWEGCLGSYRPHAEDCALKALVSDRSKLDLAQMLRKAERDLEEKTCQYERVKGYLDAMADRVAEELEEKVKVIENYEKLQRQFACFRKHMVEAVAKYEIKVGGLEKEKAELVAMLGAATVAGNHQCDVHPAKRTKN